MTRHVFLSFEEKDIDLVNLFRGQAQNSNSELEFDDYSVKDPYNSENADYIKQQIRKKLDSVSVTVCLIGHSTHKSDWVNWEIIASNAKGKRLIGVRLHNSQFDIAPSPLTRNGGKVVDWKIDDIINAIEKAAN